MSLHIRTLGGGPINHTKMLLSLSPLGYQITQSADLEIAENKWRPRGALRGMLELKSS